MSGYPCPTCGAVGFSDNCTTAGGRDHIARRNLDMDVDALLKLIANRDVGFRYAGSRTLLHVWLTEYEKRPLTSRERRALEALREAGQVEPVHAVGAFGRGYFALSGGVAPR